MSGLFELMFLPFLACLILVGIHAYLGLHVIERGVIFVDLALAQIAAFGATVGLLLGWDLHSNASYFLSLSFTLIGAGVFALMRHRHPIVPREALVGIVYAISAAASIMVLSRSAEGGEELKALMVGHLLFVNSAEVTKIFVLYSLLGIFHWLSRSPLILISRDPERAFSSGVHIKLWDFLFYASFGVVVTSSTELAGVLLVFSFLIVPSVCGVLLADSVRGRLAVGWIAGALTSFAGMILSYYLDFPTGATVVCTFGITLVACGLLRRATAA
jgi:zinc/manganese transport system permease protein